MSLADVDRDQRVYCVLQGLHFVWPRTRLGDTFYPKNVVAPIPGKPIAMRQVGDLPRVFTVSNFATAEEVAELVASSARLLAKREGVIPDHQMTTTSTSLDLSNPAVAALVNRTFQIINVDVTPGLAHPIETIRSTVLGYGDGQWHHPHLDWFDPAKNVVLEPKVNNGTNRFATIVVYLTTISDGTGHTVFPLSTTHEGYDGRRIVREGTLERPGFIEMEDASAACNASATKALRVQAVAGNAVLFYSQEPDGSLDPWSLHGGCPPSAGVVRWSGNIWVWNRPIPRRRSG